MCDSDSCPDSAEMDLSACNGADPIAKAPIPGSDANSGDDASFDDDQEMAMDDEEDSRSSDRDADSQSPESDIEYFLQSQSRSKEHWKEKAYKQKGTKPHKGHQSRRDRDGLQNGPQNQGPALVANDQAGHQPTENAACSVKSMPDYHELNGKALLGEGVQDCATLFYHGCSDTSGWMTYNACGLTETPFVPVRAMCFNVPAECFSLDASKFTDWQTPTNNSLRVASVAALLGLVYTPLSKGLKSGAHEEDARADADAAGDDEEGSRGSKAPKKPPRVSWYMSQEGENHSQNRPMLTIGYEDIYDRTLTNVVAIRVWHFVLDKTHSTSFLARKLMNENADQADHSGVAHCQDGLRRQTTVAAAKATRMLLGSSLEAVQLELAAGLCYRHVINPAVYMKLLPHYGGKSDRSPGLPPIDMWKLPAGVLNTHMTACDTQGCTHPLGFEWVFNAKRPDALRAGLVHLDGELMDVHPDQIAVTSYFDISVPAETSDTHIFRVPKWVSNNKECFFFQTDPYQRNIFDMSLPRAIAGAIKPGKELMKLFKESLKGSAAHIADDSPALLNMFNGQMSGRDQWVMKEINNLADSIVAFDTMDCTNEQRLNAKTAKKAASRGITSYGQMDGESHVVEPRQVLKEHAFATANVHSMLIAPWAASQKKKTADGEEKIRKADDKLVDADLSGNSEFEDVKSTRVEFEARYLKIMRELVSLHLAKMERSFTSRIDLESIPAGYRAVWNGLQTELDRMTNRTASIAFDLNMQLTDSDRTVFGHVTNWLGTFFEDDCFIDGRDWRLMQELFYHCFEQFGEQTLLLIFCGPKGNGKTLRTERAMKVFPRNWITMSGPSSAKAGMQGNSDSSNGSNCIYDEMIDELTDGDGSNRTEYWKMILMKREYVYNKPVVTKGADGCEMHKTFKLKTPHQETHCVCTNRGPAFTKGQEEPSEVKSALIDRAVVQFVRTLGQKTHDDQEFDDHMSQPEVQVKLRAFRILVCLMGMLKMLIFRQPYLKPDTALAQKIWDEWDEYISRKVGLPRPSPRKNIKRLENLTTMCCLNAVATVYMYKQTAWKYSAASPTPEFPNGKPFEIADLYQCVQLLAPTHEMILASWSMGLEYNIGTSAMGLNTLTIIAEATGRRVGDYLRKFPDEPLSGFVQPDDALRELAAEAEFQRAAQERAAQWKAGIPVGPSANATPPTNVPGAGRFVPSVSTKTIPALEKTFAKANDTMTPTEIRSLNERLSIRREARSEYQFRCSRSELQNTVLEDLAAMIDKAMSDTIGVTHLGAKPKGAPVVNTLKPTAPGAASGPRNEVPSLNLPPAIVVEGPTGGDEADSEYAEELDDFSRGFAAYGEGAPMSDFSPRDCEALHGWHAARAKDYPGNANCPGDHEQTDEAQLACPYCCTDVSEIVHAANKAQEITTAEYQLPGASMVFPDALEATMFYEAQTIVQFASGASAYIHPSGCPCLGTVSNGPFEYMQKMNGTTGAARIDVGWLQVIKHEWGKSWHRTAEYLRNRGSRTVMEFDMHVDGLRDCLYLVSTRDNARRLAEEPRLLSNSQPKNVLRDMNGRPIGDNTVVVKMTSYRLPGDSANVPENHEHLKRHPDSKVEDTELQRKLDSMIYGHRLSALGILTSNRIVSSPPIRMHQDGIAVSVEALHKHTQLVAESVLGCALLPGLKNMQEQFCNNQPGPDGLSAPRTDLKKRSICDNESVHTLPYSYDIVGVYLTLMMARMLYNDSAKDLMENAKEKYVKYKYDPKFEALPHISLRYVGYEEVNRQTLSVKLGSSLPKGQPYVEAGDPRQEQSHISEFHVRRSLGKKVTDADMARYIGRKQGSRSMRGVTGELFALSTWYNHTIVSLRERGLISGQEEEAATEILADMPQCIYMRAAEIASEDGHPQMGPFNMFKAVPGTYEALQELQRAGPVNETASKRTRTQASEMRFKVRKAKFGFDPNLPTPQVARTGGGLDLGVGPQLDDE